jgi:hypothetical protein
MCCVSVAPQAAATLEHLLRQELKDQQEAIADLRCVAAMWCYVQLQHNLLTSCASGRGWQLHTGGVQWHALPALPVAGS